MVCICIPWRSEWKARKFVLFPIPLLFKCTKSSSLYRNKRLRLYVSRLHPVCIWRTSFRILSQPQQGIISWEERERDKEERPFRVLGACAWYKFGCSLKSSLNFLISIFYNHWINFINTQTHHQDRFILDALQVSSHNYLTLSVVLRLPAVASRWSDERQKF